MTQPSVQPKMLLEVEHLAMSLPTADGPAAVLRDVSFNLRAGEMLGLVGESGSGKSMTARAVVGLAPRGAVFDGTVCFEGKPVLAMTPRELRRLRAEQIAFVFQDPRAHLNPIKRIGDFLTEALVRNRGMPKRAALSRAQELLIEVGIDHPAQRLRQHPHELSGGMLQRVMVAAALLAEPTLLLADEPTTALDVTTQSDLMFIVQRAQRERQMAVVFITHDLDLATAVCDRVAVLYAGEVVELADPARLRRRPLHPYTAALNASRPSVTDTDKRLAQVAGVPVSAADAPTGCAFRSRCAFRWMAAPTRSLASRSSTGPPVRCLRARELNLMAAVA